MNLIGSGTFCFEIPGDTLLQCSQNQYHLTELHCLSNILPSTEAVPKLVHLFLLNISSYLITELKKFNNKTTLYQLSIYLFQVNNRNTRAKCEMCSKLTIKTPEWHH